MLLVSMSPCFCVLCAIFVALLGLMWVRAQKSSPCVLTMAKNWRLMARWASFFAEMLLERPRWASIFADQQSWDPAGRVCCAVRLAAGPIYWHPDPSHHLSGMRASERARVRRMRSQKQKWSLTTHRRPDALYIPRERTEAAAPSALKSHAASNT